VDKESGSNQPDWISTLLAQCIINI